MIADICTAVVGFCTGFVSVLYLDALCQCRGWLWWRGKNVRPR